MSNITKMSGYLAALSLIAIIVGCGSKPPAQPAVTSPNKQAATDDKEEAEIAANLDKLSPEDRDLAVKQKVCLVSGERLGGSMGVPEKLDVKGHAVFICCQSCKDEVLNNPDKYLAKLGLTTDASQTTK